MPEFVPTTLALPGLHGGPSKWGSATEKKTSAMSAGVENAPTEMARAGISTKNTEKVPPGPKFWTPRIYPQKYPKIHKTRIFGISGVFFWYFRGIWGINSGSPEFRAGGCFFGIFLKFRVGPFRGSVAGRGVLNAGGRPHRMKRIRILRKQHQEEAQ